MKKLTALFMMCVILIAALGGCSNNQKDDASQEIATTAPTLGADDTQEAAEPTVTAAADTGITYPYVYQDAAGREVTISQEPVKVVTDYLPLWETLVMLDVMPIAATGATNYIATWDAFEGYDVTSVEELGESEVNLEKLVELQPDIILHQTYDLNNLEIDNLEKVAPVAVFGNDTKMDWRLSLREVAKVVNKEAKAEEVISELDDKLAQAREELVQKYEGQTIIQFSLMGEDRYFCAYRPDLYDDETGLGLNLPEGYTTSQTYEQISMESIVAMNPDYIFINIFDGDEALYENLQNNTVWNSLKAVKEEHVYILDGSGHACSPLATLYTINFITDALISQ
jgi:iron complex transport system substrate-binding protein